jgi:hypothetical protein
MTALPPSRSASDRAARRILGREGRLRGSIVRRFAGRRARRRLVVAWTAVVVATAALPLVARLQDVLGPAVVVDGVGLKLVADPIAWFVVASLIGWVLRMAVRSVADLPDEEIDERQVALRDRTYLIAYRILAVTVAWLVLAAYIVADASATRIVSSSVADWIMSDAMFVVIPLVAFLPSAVFAWYAPDEMEDETEDEVDDGS